MSPATTEQSKTAPNSHVRKKERNSRAKKRERNSPGTTVWPSSFGKRARDCFDTRAANRNCGSGSYSSVNHSSGNYTEVSFRRTSRSHTNSERSSSASYSGHCTRLKRTEPTSPCRLAAARSFRVRFLGARNRGSMRQALTSFPTMGAIATSRC